MRSYLMYRLRSPARVACLSAVSACAAFVRLVSRAPAVLAHTCHFTCARLADFAYYRVPRTLPLCLLRMVLRTFCYRYLLRTAAALSYR